MRSIYHLATGGENKGVEASYELQGGGYKGLVRRDLGLGEKLHRGQQCCQQARQQPQTGGGALVQGQHQGYSTQVRQGLSLQ